MLHRIPMTPPAIALLLAAASIAACSSPNSPSETVSASETSLSSDKAAKDACKLSQKLQHDALARTDDELDPAAARGRHGFNDRVLEGLAGNGRACADCHMGSDSFQLSPANAKARVEALETCRTIDPSADDPLVRAVDADDFRTNGTAASSFNNLKFGLIRITLKLPAQVRLIDPATNLPSTETHADVWRSVPSINDVAITGADSAGRRGDNGGAENPLWPNPAGGYQLDGRVLTLEAQAQGALNSHAETQNAAAPGFLSDIAAFQKTRFSSPSVAALAELMLAGTPPFPDPDPELNTLEQEGKATFNKVCATCHGSNGHPSTSSPVIGQRYHQIRSTCPRVPTPAQAPDGPDNFGNVQLPPCPANVTANARIYEFTNPNGTKQRVNANDLGRAFFTGRFADRFAFDVPSIRGFAKTPPFFHNNSVSSVEELVEFYRVLFIAVRRTFAPPNLPPIISSDGSTFDRFFTVEEAPGLVAYLKKI